MVQCCFTLFELIQQESGIQVRYRYDWHIGAMPERYTYDKTGQKQPLNELALDLIPGDYGRAVCNGRFRDWDTGIWYYVLDILNVMPLAESTDSLTSLRTENRIRYIPRSTGCGNERQEGYYHDERTHPHFRRSQKQRSSS